MSNQVDVTGEARTASLNIMQAASCVRNAAQAIKRSAGKNPNPITPGMRGTLKALESAMDSLNWAAGGAVDVCENDANAYKESKEQHEDLVFSEGHWAEVESCLEEMGRVVAWANCRIHQQERRFKREQELERTTANLESAGG